MNDNLNPDTFAKLLGKMLKDVETNRMRLHEEMALVDPTSLPGHVRLVKDLALAAVDLSKEARAWLKQHKEMGKKLTLAERCDLTLQFLAKLSPADKTEMRTRIREVLGG